MNRAPVPATARKSMTPKRRRELREHQGDLCAVDACGKPWTEIDHRVPLWMGGSEALPNLAGLCDLHHLAKTAADATARAKVKRLRGETCAGPKRQIRGQGFTRWRNMRGEIVERQP